jgi:hypothetical protein
VRGSTKGAFNCSEHGVDSHDPQVFSVEDGKQSALDPAVLDMKRFDPLGLPNYGELDSRDTRKPS